MISAGLLAHLDVRNIDTPCAFWSFAGLDPTGIWYSAEKVKGFVKEACDEQGSSAPDEKTIEKMCFDMHRNKNTVTRMATTKPNGDPKKLTRDTLTKSLSLRPWNAALKSLCAFKLGECFVKVQKNKNDFYGKLFRGRRDFEEDKNLAGNFAKLAESILASKNFSKDTDAYKAYISGQLPPAHLHARARRYTVKIFLSHLHYVMYEDLNGMVPAKPPIFSDPSVNLGGKHSHWIAPPNWPFEGGGKCLEDLYNLDTIATPSLSP